MTTSRDHEGFARRLALRFSVHLLMRSLGPAAVISSLLLLLSPIAGQARDLGHHVAAAGTGKQDANRPITLTATAGYQGIYRDTTWVPVRVSLQNRSNTNIAGVLRLPQSSAAPVMEGPQTFHGLYQMPVVLPGGSSKQVTLYVPGSGVQGEIDVRFDRGDKILAATAVYPTGIDSSVLLIGTLAGSPADTSWLAPAIQQRATTHIISLTAATLDPYPEALAAFDIIVMTDVDTSQLDGAQRTALAQYVQNGGSLLLVGGPNWQKTLRPLPSDLLPGRIVGTDTLPNLAGLRSLASLPRGSRQATVVSDLSQATGTVVAGQAGIPLVVRKIVGRGTIEYLAFDPALNPVQSWPDAPALLGHLIAAAAPLAVSRTWSPQGFRLRFARATSTTALTSELANLPPLQLPLLTVFALLTLVYVLLLGPANYLVLRWMNRQSLAAITIPILALSYLGSGVGLATHLQGSAAILNSVGMIALDGSGPQQATFYLGLVAPLPGTYQLTYHAPALPAPVPQLTSGNGFFWRSSAPLTPSPLGMTVQEGNPATIDFLDMKQWAMKDVALSTSVPVNGSVHGDLRVDTQGDIAGSIRNATDLDLLDPVLVAGQSYTHLPTMPAGSTVRVRVQPSGPDSGDQVSVWNRLYGGIDFGDGDGFFARFGGCCGQSSYPPEPTLAGRVRNAAAMLAQEQSLATLGDIVLVGWTTKSFANVTVNGSAPQRRDLTLIAAPMSVRFPPRGPFTLDPGTYQPHLVDIQPQAPQTTCCNFFSRINQSLTVGVGGSLTFEFDLPDSGRLHFYHLALGISSSDNGTSAGRVYSWAARRWVPVDLSGGAASLASPQQFVSPDGRLLLQLRATTSSGDVTIDDPNNDVQLSGSGVAS